MSSDRRSLRLPFSEPSVDHPAQTAAHPFPTAEQTLFQQPPDFEPELPTQARGRATQAAGGPNFSTPERQG